VNIVISKHAKDRIKTYNLTEKLVADCIIKPDKTVTGYAGTLIAHKVLNAHVLRIVYTKDKDIINVITVYPAKKARYFKK